MTNNTRKELTHGQSFVLGAAAVAMVAIGGFGAWGTYTNVVSKFHREATAAGVVAAGEGLTLILALTMLGLTMLGQAAPLWVRAGLWLAPVTASLTGLAIAEGRTESAVFVMTPLAMSGAAEGLGLIARRVVVYRTGVDVELLRRNADAVQKLAYQRALAEGHPDEDVRETALRESWKIAEHVGVGDTQLGASLVEVQRLRVREGADAALSGMYRPALPAAAPQTATRPRPATATEALRREFAGMDPAEAIRLAHDARPDAPPAELASLLVSYGVVVDAVQVALVLGTRPAEHIVERASQQGATGVAPQVGGDQPALTKSEAIRDVAQLLGPDAPAEDIASGVARRHRIEVKPNFVRAVLSRSKKPATDAPETPARDEGNGGYN